MFAIFIRNYVKKKNRKIIKHLEGNRSIGVKNIFIIIFFLCVNHQLTKINHHRGPVTAVKISAASDVLISSSTDASVCLWSLDDYSLLNTIQLSRPIINIQISIDSIFLLAHCEDNGLYLRTLATGTELHALKGHKSKVSKVKDLLKHLASLSSHQFLV
jgi:WD40 repeat protein